MKAKQFFLCMIFLIVCIKAYSYDFEYQGFAFNIDKYGFYTDGGYNENVYVTGFVDQGEGNADYYVGDLTIPTEVYYNYRSYKVKAIGDGAFACSYGLTSITIPEGITSIGQAAFLSCQSLKSIVIPEGVKTIGPQAFDNCYYNLTSVTIPSTVTKIGHRAFRNCSKLAKAEFASIESLCRIDFDNDADANPLSKAHHLFINGEEVIKVDIPNSVTSIGSYAFYGGSFLTSVTIPNSVTSIGDYAFAYNSGPTSVKVDLEYPLTIKSSTFTNRSDATLYVPAGCKTAYEAADYWKEFKEIKEIQPGMIFFADANVKALCVANWDTNEDGELSEAETAAVTSLGTVFRNSSTITSFDELQYFKGLTSIGSSAFYYCKNLRSITIPENVTSIGSSAFYCCTNLRSITIPENVTSISDELFDGCENLKSITIPENVTSIGNRAFSYCKSLVSIYIPNSVTSIGDYAFSNCSGLTSLTIPNSVTSIGWGAFYDCTGLTSIFIGNSVTNICNKQSGMPIGNAFSGCSSLTSVIVDSENTIYDSRNNCNAIIETATNTLIVGCMNTVIPESVTAIGDEAFQGSDGLTSITIPYSVVKIGGNPFRGCDCLASIIVDNKNRIYDSRNNCNAIIETATNTLIAGCMNTIIPESVTKIGDYAFRGCSYLSSVIIGSGVTEIGRDAFEGTAWYNNQPDGVVYAGNVAYGYKGNRPSGTLTFKDGTIGITRSAFSDCYITSVTIPNSVKNIGSSAFRGCSYLSSVIIGSGVTEIGRDAFEGTAWYNNQPGGLVYAGNVAYKYKGTMPSGTEIILNEGTLGIAGAAFQNCTGLTSIIVPNSVVSFGDEAFDNCNMTSINIPEGVTKIGYSVFWGCTKLTSVTIPNSVKVIGEAAFWNCKSMTSLTIPIGVADIGWTAFQYCSGLTSVIIPNSVKRIDEYAFLYCSSLTDVWCYSNTPPVTHTKAYYESSIGSATLHVPTGCKAAYKLADCWKEFGSIIEFIEGDVNSDGETDVVDVVDIARFVVGTPAETFVEILADINRDGSVNIGDAVALVNEIAGDQNFVRAKRAPSKTAESEDVLSLTQTDEGLALALVNQRDYTAFQFDLFVPEGIDVARMLLNAERKQKHQLLYNKVEEGHYRVAAFSTSNRTFMSNNGTLLSFALDSDIEGEISIRDIHFFDTEGGDYMFNEILYEGTTTGIAVTPSTTPMDGAFYTIDGRRMGEKPTTKGLYIVNGKKVVIK